MHPLLLFTLLFLPGIKSLHDVSPGFLKVRRNGDEFAAISNTDIAPIEEPQTVVTTSSVKTEPGNGLKPYESHVTKNFEKHRNKERLLLKNDREFSSAKGTNKHEETSQEKYPYQTFPQYHEDKQLHHKKMEKDHEKKKHLNKMHNHKLEDKKFYESKTYKNTEGHKNEKPQDYDREFIEKEKIFKKAVKKELSNKEKERHTLKKDQFKYKKAAEKYYKKHFKYNNEMKRLERTKRYTESSESDDEDYNTDDEEISDENVSLGSVEKHFFAHLLDVKDDSPYDDTIDVKLKQRNDDDHELVPVVEDLITKKTAYISCGRKGGPGCGRDQQDVGDHEYSVHVKTLPKDQEDESDGDHIDMEAWLKAFEESIINSGVKYNHQ